MDNLFVIHDVGSFREQSVLADVMPLAAELAITQKSGISVG
jgi:hypothetical protein